MQFKKIYYPKFLKESLRDYLCVNRAGQLSYLYKFLLCVLMPLQTQWEDFETYRAKIWLISQCKWSIGQLTNVLNYLYDPLNNSIYISQSTIDVVFVPVFAETTKVFATVYAETTSIFAPTFDDLPKLHPAIINVPSSVYSDASIMSDLTATLVMIRPLGLKSQIEEIAE